MQGIEYVTNITLCATNCKQTIKINYFYSLFLQLCIAGSKELDRLDPDFQGTKCTGDDVVDQFSLRSD